MKKEKMITRTFTRTNLEVMQVNTSTCEVAVKGITLDFEFKSEDDALKHCKSLYENSDIKVVKVEITTTEDVLIGMTLSDFYKYGQVLPPRPASQQKGYNKEVKKGEK